MPRGGKQDIDSGRGHWEKPIAIADLLTGAAAALWLIPISMIFDPVPEDVFALTVGLAGALSMTTFLLGVVYRTQRRGRERYETREAETDKSIADLRELVMDLQIAANAQATDLAKRIDQVAARVERDRWNAYAEGHVDNFGGEAVVDSMTTRRLPDNSASVYRLPQHRDVGGRV
jgi:hypothetical protein